MGKIRKIRQGNSLYVTEDETLVVVSNSRNGVYVYNLKGSTSKPVFATKTVSDVACYALSQDKKMLAAKSTSGEIALISLETGEELLRNEMWGKEGYPIVFTNDAKYVLDMDWNGRTMLLDCETNQVSVVDGPNIRGRNGYPYVSYMQYDRYSQQIIKIVEKAEKLSTGVVMASSSVPGKIKYRKIRKFKGYVPGWFDGISLCKDRNYYYERFNGIIVVTDKQFRELKRCPLPVEFAEFDSTSVHMWVSPCEKYLFLYCRGLSVLYEMKTMKPMLKFEYPFVCDFTMVEEDSKFIISTWQGAYFGDIEE